MTMAIAGDIKGIETLAGQAGASATYNCVMCTAKLHETYNRASRVSSSVKQADLVQMTGVRFTPSER